MKILVSGSEGYVGSLLIPNLIQGGHEVISINTRSNKVDRLDGSKEPTVKTLHKCIRHLTVEDLQGIEAVIHIAELAGRNVQYASTSGQLVSSITYNIHYKDSIHLANIAKTAGVSRFVYLSSCSVYGAASDEYLTEVSPVNPQTPHAMCKALVEKDIRAIADDSFSPTFLRRAIAYGASPRMRFDIAFNKLAGLAWTIKEIRIPNDGNSWQPLVHVLDICKAILCTLEAPRELVHNQIFNVGDTAHNYQLTEIAAIVSDVFQVCQVSFIPSDSSYIKHRVSFEKINKLLPGFQCDWNAQRGAQQLLSFFSLTDIVKNHSLCNQIERWQQQAQLIKVE